MAVISVIGILDDSEKERETVRRLNETGGRSGWSDGESRLGLLRRMRNGDGCIIILLLHTPL